MTRNDRVVLFVGLAFAAVVIIAIGLSVGSLYIATKVDHNSDSIKQLERKDTISLRDAAYRVCEREQRDRAEQHFRAGLLPPDQAQAIIVRLGLPASFGDRLTLKAIRRRLPIFDCEPNLRGKPARVMSDREQIRYVQNYISGRLAPVPAVPPAKLVLSGRATASPSVPAPGTPAPTTSTPPPAPDRTPTRRAPTHRRSAPPPAPSQAPSPAPAPTPSPSPQPMPLPGLPLPCLPLLHPC